MIKLVFDACSLIYLTKIKLKEKLSSLGEAFVSKTVKIELIADLDRFPDAKTLKANLDKKIIKENKLELKDIYATVNLGKGERETIEISTIIDDGILVTDDQLAIKFALNLGLKPKTSEIILLDFLSKNLINYQEYKKFFHELAIIKALKPEIISFFREQAKIIVDKKKEENKGG